MKNILLALIILSSTLITGCNFSASYLNRDEDKKDGEKVTDQLFADLKVKNYDAAFSLFSKRFFEATSKEKLQNIFTATQDKLGNLKNSEISKWETKIVNGTNPSADYEFLYKNQYDKYPADVYILLSKDPDGKVRVIGYRISSDGFFAK